MQVKNYILIKLIAVFFLTIALSACGSKYDNSPEKAATGRTNAPLANPRFDSSIKIIHVLVALCDNKYQGIVPVPAAIGNGQDVNSNLYWGCAGGLRGYFKNSKNWALVKKYYIDSTRLERVVFKYKKTNWLLLADAYNGKFIRQCTIDFLQSCSGRLKDTLHIDDKIAGINGNAKLLAYIGHDGLMDFTLPGNYNNVDSKIRDVMLFACISKKYFSPYIAAARAKPLLWSTGLMSPEAYTLHDALNQYIANAGDEAIRDAGANAYARYQKCGVGAAKRLLVQGF